MIINVQACEKCNSHQNVGILEIRMGTKTTSTHIWCDNCNVDIVLELKLFDTETNRLLNDRETWEYYLKLNEVKPYTNNGTRNIL